MVLTDFSACHLRDVDGHRRSRGLLRQVGLTEHSAPEYAMDDEVGRRSDQYSLASTVYWLLTGALPFEVPVKDLLRHTDLERMHYRSARALNPEVPEALDEALKRALTPQRALRFRRLSEFLHALKTPTPPVPSEAPPKRGGAGGLLAGRRRRAAGAAGAELVPPIGIDAGWPPVVPSYKHRATRKPRRFCLRGFLFLAAISGSGPAA